MSIKSRLRRLEAWAARRQSEPPPSEQPEANSRRWLAVLECWRELPARLGAGAPPGAVAAARSLAAELQEPAALLRGYVESGKLGAHVEYHCGCRLNVFAGWWHAEPGDSGYGQPIPFEDELAKLQQCLQIDAARGGSDASGEARA